MAHGASIRCPMRIQHDFLKLFNVNDIMTLKFGLEVTQGHSNRYHSKAWVQFPIRLLCLSADVAAPIKDPAPL